MDPLPVSLGDGTRKASTAQLLGRCPGSTGTAGSKAVTLQRCTSELGGGPGEHVLRKVSFRSTLPRSWKGSQGAGVVVASVLVQTQSPSLSMSPSEWAVLPLTCGSAWDGTWAGLGDCLTAMFPLLPGAWARWLLPPGPLPSQTALSSIPLTSLGSQLHSSHPSPSSPGRGVHCPLYLTVWEFLLRLCLHFAVLICTSLGSFIPLHPLLCGAFPALHQLSLRSLMLPNLFWWPRGPLSNASEKDHHFPC